MSAIRKLRRLLRNRPVALVGSKSTTKYSRHTKNEMLRRRKIFDKTRPHHGDDLIKALEFEVGLRNDYEKA